MERGSSNRLYAGPLSASGKQILAALRAQSQMHSGRGRARSFRQQVPYFLDERSEGRTTGYLPESMCSKGPQAGSRGTEDRPWSRNQSYSQTSSLDSYSQKLALSLNSAPSTPRGRYSLALNTPSQVHCWRDSQEENAPTFLLNLPLRDHDSCKSFLPRAEHPRPHREKSTGVSRAPFARANISGAPKNHVTSLGNEHLASSYGAWKRHACSQEEPSMEQRERMAKAKSTARPDLWSPVPKSKWQFGNLLMSPTQRAHPAKRKADFDQKRPESVPPAENGDFMMWDMDRGPTFELRMEDDIQTSCTMQKDGFGATPTFETDGDGANYTLETDGFGAAHTLETDGFGAAHTLETDGFGAAHTLETDGFGAAHTLETDGFGATQTLEIHSFEATIRNISPLKTDGFGSTHTLESDGFGATHTLSIDGCGVTPTLETDGFGATHTLETDGFGATNTLETDGFEANNTLETDGFGETHTLETDGFDATIRNILPLKTDGFGATPTLEPDGIGATNTLETNGFVDTHTLETNGFVATTRNVSPLKTDGLGATRTLKTDGFGETHPLETNGSGATHTLETDGFGASHGLQSGGFGEDQCFTEGKATENLSCSTEHCHSLLGLVEHQVAPQRDITQSDVDIETGAGPGHNHRAIDPISRRLHSRMEEREKERDGKMEMEGDTKRDKGKGDHQGVTERGQHPEDSDRNMDGPSGTATQRNTGNTEHSAEGRSMLWPSQECLTAFRAPALWGSPLGQNRRATKHPHSAQVCDRGSRYMGQDLEPSLTSPSLAAYGRAVVLGPGQISIHPNGQQEKSSQPLPFIYQPSLNSSLRRKHVHSPSNFSFPRRSVKWEPPRPSQEKTRSLQGGQDSKTPTPEHPHLPPACTFKLCAKTLSDITPHRPPANPVKPRQGVSVKEKGSDITRNYSSSNTSENTPSKKKHKPSKPAGPNMSLTRVKSPQKLDLSESAVTLKPSPTNPKFV
ncbi:hypothetical protein UPYG_G00238320 [Umbra pygmaea]|uniref:Uncharacterized protein n=1 Tax=Umbra pygmaea TaxID=75934 RepID=A0ABD0WER2_UMBPY